jgi:hypothetical protein
MFPDELERQDRHIAEEEAAAIAAREDGKFDRLFSTAVLHVCNNVPALACGRR